MQWTLENENELVFCVKADRYLRGMVKGLVGTMLKVGRGIYNIDDLKKIMLTQDKSMVSFAVPGSALYLTEVRYAQEFYDIPTL
jgi:tRNA pseudouridine38-40 synthase